MYCSNAETVTHEYHIISITHTYYGTLIDALYNGRPVDIWIFEDYKSSEEYDKLVDRISSFRGKNLTLSIWIYQPRIFVFHSIG